jgi:hypothetical protein
MECTKIDLPKDELLPILKVISASLNNERKGAPENDINLFDATSKDIEDAINTGKYMDPEFYNKDKSVAWYENNKENVLKNFDRLKTYRLENAPDREEMPVIEDEQVPGIVPHKTFTSKESKRETTFTPYNRESGVNDILVDKDDQKELMRIPLDKESTNFHNSTNLRFKRFTEKDEACEDN